MLCLFLLILILNLFIFLLLFELSALHFSFDVIFLNNLLYFVYVVGIQVGWECNERPEYIGDGTGFIQSYTIYRYRMVICNPSVDRLLWTIQDRLELPVKVPCGSLVVPHKVNVIAILIELCFCFRVENPAKFFVI